MAASRQRHKPARRAPSTQRTVLGAFFLSGFAGLMHQVVWAKLLAQLIGATAHAQAVVLAVFMGGLALGAVWLGRRADRDARPLRTYVWLECLIAGYCLLLPLLLLAAERGYIALAELVFESSGLKLLLRCALAVLAVLPPAVLMGGTLPVLARHLVGRVEDTQRQVANLYALNSLGAVLGAGIAGFVTLPAFGVYVSLGLAALLNLVAGLVVLPLARRAAPAPPAPARAATVGATYSPSQYTVTLMALALSGFAAMGYEVLFARVIGLAFGSSTHSFTVMLMAFITGIALGSAIVARRTVRRPLWWLAVSQLGVVVALLAVTPLVARLPYVIALQRIALLEAPNGFELDLLGKAGLCLAILLVPTTCLGFGFPLVARVQARSPQDIGARVGSTYAWNTVGNVLGAVLTSLVLLPALGLNGAFHANLALNAAAGVLLLAVADEAARPRRLALAAAAAAVLALYAAVGTGWSDSIRYAVRHLRLRSAADPALDAAARARHPASNFAAWEAAFVRPPGSRTPYFFAEDAHTTVLAFAENPGNIFLHVNGKADASSSTDLDTQLLLAHAPLLMVRDTASVLVIGYGSGITTGSVLRYPVERVDVVEISRGVLQADALFAEANGGALADPRVHVYEDDGQSFLRTVPRTYDVIISEPSNPWIAGVGNLFTVEFFAAARDRLKPGGVFTCWFHTYEQSDENVALIVRTLTTVFPHALIFADADFGNGVAVASLEPLAPDFAAMETRYAAVRTDLARLAIPNLLAMLSHQRVSAATARELVGDGPLNSVAHPRLEYAAPRAMFEHDASFMLEQLDPLITADAHDDALLLDRYLAYRAAAGRPVEAAELDAAATYAAQMGGYGPTVAESIRARAGGVPPP